MSSSRRHLLVALAACLPLLACSSSRGSYTGPMPSASAQAELRALRGSTFVDTGGVLGGGTWTIGPLRIAKYEGVPGGRCPQLEITQGDVTHGVPVLTDGDASALHKRIASAELPGVSAEQSAAYRSFWVGK